MGSKKKRPVLKNKDGSTSSEITQTIGTPHGYLNVPTIDPVRRQSITTDEGVKLERARTGNNPKFFKTVGGATAAAAKRSAAGGAYRNKPKDQITEAMDEILKEYGRKR